VGHVRLMRDGCDDGAGALNAVYQRAGERFGQGYRPGRLVQPGGLSHAKTPSRKGEYENRRPLRLCAFA